MFAKWLFWIGIAFVAGSLIAYLSSKSGIHLGKLPLDFSWHSPEESKNKVSVFFPLGTCLLLSIVFSLLSYLFFRLKK